MLIYIIYIMVKKQEYIELIILTIKYFKKQKFLALITIVIFR